VRWLVLGNSTALTYASSESLQSPVKQREMVEGLKRFHPKAMRLSEKKRYSSIRVRVRATVADVETGTMAIKTDAAPLSRSEFVETAPLYTRTEIIDFSPPDSITRMCTNTKCKKETTWSKDPEVRIDLDEAHPGISFRAVAYSCVLCNRQSFAIIYELLNWSAGAKGTTHYHHTAVRKIGQVPQPMIDVPAELNDRLASTALYYRRALVCREQGYGIAAMAYLRRVVDEKTDELIDVMVELSRTFGVEDEEIDRLLRVKVVSRFDAKLQEAADLIPVALRPGGLSLWANSISTRV
jgi:hypothetical protein